LKAAESHIKATQQEILEESRRLEDLNGGAHARRLAELEEKRAEAVEIRIRYGNHQRDFDRIQGDVHKAEQEIKAKIAPITKQTLDIEQSEKLLRSLSKDRGQQDSGFHEKMSMLLGAIQQEHSFGRHPVGPLGHHVRLVKPEWSAVLETSFGATLTSFVVTSKRDMNILSGIMQRVGW
jgi:ATP-dependent RNA helicase DDX6/DHH1